MDGYITIGTELDTKSFDAQIDYVKGQLDDIEYKLKQADMGLEVGDVLKLEAQYKKLNYRLRTLVERKEQLNSIDFSRIGKSIDKVIKKITKWSIAVFGISGAYMAIRNAMNVISSQDSQLKADIDYMKNAIAYTLEPVVRTIVDLARQLLSFIRDMIFSLTGKNIFENANKSLKSANNQAKQLSKTLAGFDEMNIINDNSSAGGTTNPSFDLAQIKEIPGWMKVINAGILGIVGSIAALKLGNLLKNIGLIKASLSGSQLLGIGLIIGGIAYSIMEIIDYIENPSWRNFGGILEGIGVAVAGIGIAFASVPLMIAGAITIILGIMAEFWDEIDAFLKNLTDNIYTTGDNIMNWLHENFGILGDLLNVLVGTLTGVVAGIVEIIDDLFGGLFTGVKDILDGIILLFEDWDEGIIKIVKGLANVLFGVLNAVIDAINLVVSPIRALIVAVGKVTGQGWTMENIRIPNVKYLAKGGIINMPGHGVPVGSAIGGERGAEGVIPLTDSQQMQLLGEAIGKYITINANITNTMNGRVISKELQKIQSESNFAYNG